jgi:GntR family transcriptional regulator, transcriptional repressor for pyruvate dehydrogenase complex
VASVPQGGAIAKSLISLSNAANRVTLEEHMAIMSNDLPITEPTGAEQVSPIQDIIVNLTVKIVAGELEEGDLIPSREELALVQGVSVGSVARALDLMETMEFVENRGDGATVVTAAKAVDFGHSLRSVRTVNSSMVAKLLVTLSYIEPALASLAALNSTEQNLSDLRDALRRMTYAAEMDSGDYMIQDNQFHGVIGDTSRREAFASMVKSMRIFLSEPRSTLFVVYNKDVHTILDQHIRIYHAIKEKELKASYDSMQDHIAHWIGCNVGLVSELYRWSAGRGTEKSSHRGSDLRFLTRRPLDTMTHTRALLTALQAG